MAIMISDITTWRGPNHIKTNGTRCTDYIPIKESTMVNKQEFIKKAKEWLEDINFERMYQYSEDGYTFFDKESFMDDFLKAMEE